MLPEKVFPEKFVRTNSTEELRELLATDFQVTYSTTDLASIKINPEGTASWNGESLPFTRCFLEASARFIGMPRAYADHIDFGLFKYNFDERKQKECCGVMVCISRGAAINICRANYFPARTLDVVDQAQQQIVGKRFHEAVVSDRGIELSWIDKANLIEPKPGDTILHGLRISNSEVGGRALKASLYTLNLACQTGAVLSDEWGAARWSYDRRVTYKANLAHFFQDLKRIEVKAPELSGVYEQLVDQSLTDLEFVNLWRRLRSVVGPQNADDIVFATGAERRRLFNQVRSRREQTAAVATSFNSYEIHNRVTSAAQDYEFPEWQRLQEIGGSILQRPLEK